MNDTLKELSDNLLKNKKVVSAVIGITGVFIMIFGKIQKSDTASMPAETVSTQLNVKDTATDKVKLSQTVASYDTNMESRLEDILSELKGIGNVSVSVTLDASEEKVMAVEIIDSKSVVAVGKHSEPILVKENAPRLRGVVVLAEGANTPTVQKEIKKIINLLTQVDFKNISVYEFGNELAVPVSSSNP